MEKVRVKFIWNRGIVIARIYMPNGSQGHYSTGIKIPKKYFDGGAIRSPHKEHEPLVDKLVEEYYEARSLEPYPNEMGIDFVDRLKKRTEVADNMVPKSLLQAMRYTIDRKNDVTASRMSAYRNSLEYLSEFLNQHAKCGDMKLRELDGTRIDEFLVWLQEQKQLSPKTASIYVSAIHASIDYVAKRFVMYDEVPGYNPIEDYGKLSTRVRNKLKKKTLQNHLTEEDVFKIKKLLEPSAMTAQDHMFVYIVLWQIYVGSSFVDTFFGTFFWSYNSKDEGFLTYWRRKTETECFVPVAPWITEVAYKLDSLYSVQMFSDKPVLGDMQEGAVFMKYRRFLTKIIEPLLNKKVSSHTFRHTFGHRMINKFGYPVEQVQKMMGHTDISTTMNNYAQMTLNGMKNLS